MPRLANAAAVEAMFRPHVGKYDVSYHAHLPDIAPFVDLASLKPGESVLDLGTGSALVLVEAKCRVKDGVCVGVDLCQGLLEQDARWNLAHAGFSNRKSTDKEHRVYLQRGDITSPALLQGIKRELPEGILGSGFDVIIGLWVYDLLPWALRDVVLRTWKSWLKPGGRLVLHMCLQTTDPARANSEGTESPAVCTIEEMTRLQPVNGVPTLTRQVVGQVNFAPAR